MTKIFNFALKIKGGGRRVAHAKSSDPATPQNLKRALDQLPIPLTTCSTGSLRLLVFDPWPLSKIVFHLKLMQSKTFNFMINLQDVENITKWLDSILT